MPKPKVTHCKHGHKFDVQNTYWYINAWGRPARACKQCSRHRQEMYRREKGAKSRKPSYEKLMKRFWSKVLKTRTCWLWQSTVNPGGYGRFWITPKISVMAHRFAYELEIGEIPEGFEAHHMCDNQVCVNPAHIQPIPRTEHRKLKRKVRNG